MKKNVLTTETIRQERNIFRLIVGQYKNTEEAVRAGKYNRVDHKINGRNFPLRSRPAGKRIIELIDEFDHDPTSEEVIKEARKRVLESPTYEDVFDFGEQYYEEQREQPIVFLHDWQYLRGHRCVLVLRGCSFMRSLLLGWFDGKWPAYFAFAFVHPSAGKAGK